jgi:hypothetical protein
VGNLNNGDDFVFHGLCYLPFSSELRAR